MAFADLDVVLMPRNRILHDLTVNAGISAKFVALGPIFKVE